VADIFEQHRPGCEGGIYRAGSKSSPVLETTREHC
jgi:hypothetical protein